MDRGGSHRRRTLASASRSLYQVKEIPELKRQLALFGERPGPGIGCTKTPLLRNRCPLARV